MNLSGRRVLLYARVSTEEQARSGESITDQLQALRDWAKSNRCIIVSEHVDSGYSAHKAFRTRPALRDLLDRLPEADMVAFTKLDRWSRRSRDYYALQDLLDAHGVSWVAILEDYETFTSDGRFKVGIMLSVNQHEAERTSDRVKFTFEQKRLRGEIPTGNLPPGYIMKDKKAIKDPERAAGVAAFWQAYLSGSGLSNAIQAAAGAGAVMRYRVWATMIARPERYAGTIQGVQAEPYITAEDLLTIRRIRRTGGAPTGYVYLFTGIVKCATCGGSMNGAHVARSKTRYEQTFYRCGRHHAGNICPNAVNITEGIIERHLLDHMNELIQGAEEQRLTAQEEPDQPARVSYLTTRRKRAVEAYLEGLLTREELRTEQESIDAQLERLRAPKKALPPILSIRPEEWLDTYAELDREHRRAFWLRIIERIDIHEDRTITARVRV